LHRQEWAVGKARWHALPIWKKMLVILAIGLCFLGILWLKLAVTVVDHMYGGIALLAGVGMLCVTKKIHSAN